MMRLVDPEIASEFSIRTQSAWLQVGWGRATALPRFLGAPVVRDHLPGLGELSGWGILDEQYGLSGAVFTGFYPNPNMVVFMLSCDLLQSGLLSSFALDVLMDLPARMLNDFSLLSLVSGGAVIEVRDREHSVLQTKSRS